MIEYKIKICGSPYTNKNKEIIDPEESLLQEMGNSGWILSSVIKFDDFKKFYFYRVEEI